jgi:hypothetical protein
MIIWEVDVFATFFNLLYLVIVRREGVDKFWWPPPKKDCSMLEEYLVDYGSFDSGFFCLVGNSRKDPYHGQS